jgi:hypothetical protein
MNIFFISEFKEADAISKQKMRQIQIKSKSFQILKKKWEIKGHVVLKAVNHQQHFFPTHPISEEIRQFRRPKKMKKKKF